METNREKGNIGESLAADYLQDKGYVILHRNWRRGHWELDLIAEKEGLLHFIEVKTRTGKIFGFPEERVNKDKIRTLMRAASAYLETYPERKRFQIDILSINLHQKKKPEFLLIEDIYDF